MDIIYCLARQGSQGYAIPAKDNLTDQVNQLIRRIRNDENSDSTPARALNKLIKVAKYAFADSTMLRITNHEPLHANVRRHHKANRSGAHFGGKARVLSLEDVQ